MAAGFTLLKDKAADLENFILKDYTSKVSNFNLSNFYDSEILPSALNINFFNEIQKLGPFGNENILPVFFLKNLKVVKVLVLQNKHISAILKSNTARIR